MTTAFRVPDNGIINGGAQTACHRRIHAGLDASARRIASTTSTNAKPRDCHFTAPPSREARPRIRAAQQAQHPMEKGRDERHTRPSITICCAIPERPCTTNCGKKTMKKSSAFGLSKEFSIARMNTDANGA